MHLVTFLYGVLLWSPAAILPLLPCRLAFDHRRPLADLRPAPTWLADSDSAFSPRRLPRHRPAPAKSGILSHLIVLKSLAFYDQTFLSAGIPHGRDYNRPFALPRGLRGLLELFYCGVLCSGSLCERVAVQPAQTDVHLFTSRTIPRENQAQSQQSCAGAHYTKNSAF